MIGFFRMGCEKDIFLQQYSVIGYLTVVLAIGGGAGGQF